jgi:hypothetical protein
MQALGQIQNSGTGGIDIRLYTDHSSTCVKYGEAIRANFQSSQCQLELDLQEPDPAVHNLAPRKRYRQGPRSWC